MLQLLSPRSWFQRKDAVSAPINASANAFNPVYGLFLAQQELTASHAWLLYENVSPFAKVVDLIADQVAGLDPLVTVDDQPADPTGAVAAFMERPGFNRDRRRFIKELTVQLLVTGTSFLGVYGNVKYTPSALDVLKTFYVTPIQGYDMWPMEYWYTEGTLSNRYYRDGGRDFRWISQDGLSEIIPIMDMDGSRRGIGLSRLSAIKLDVELRLSGAEHNMAMMKNGARPSGALVFKDRMTPEQKADVGAQIKHTVVGAGNAGKVMLFTGGEAEFIAMSQTAKDMDWTNLVKAVENAIVARYNVPTTIYDSVAQTDNNYETAWHQFYDNAVLPTFNIVWSQIGRMLSDRMSIVANRDINLKIKHDTLTNNTLARQAASRAVQLRTAGLITTNESRSLIGYEPVLGGDALLAPAGEVPIGEDYFTSSDAEGNPLKNPPEPAELTDDRRGRSADKSLKVVLQ